MTNSAQTPGARACKARRMSMVAWYLDKASQCAQMAKDATEPYRRAVYEHEQQLWLQIAERIEENERNRLGSGPR